MHLVLKTAPDSSREEMTAVEKWVMEIFEGAKLDRWGGVGGQVRFSVPAGLSFDQEREAEGVDEIVRIGSGKGKARGRKGGVAELFRKLEDCKEELGLAFYSVRPTSMDEVFLNVVRENNVREEGGRGK